MTSTEKQSKLTRLIRSYQDILNTLILMRDNDIGDIDDMLTLNKQMEYTLLSFNNIIADMEAYQNDILPNLDFDFSNLSPKEKTEVNRYISQFCKGIGENGFTFEKYKTGYKAVIPYLLNRRAKKNGLYFSPKKKYINSIFKSLLINNTDIINRLRYATVFIVSCSPNEKRAVRDNDNADAHDIINLIKEYMLADDDDGISLNICYDARVTNLYFTEIYVMPKVNSDCILSLYV